MPDTAAPVAEKLGHHTVTSTAVRLEPNPFMTETATMIAVALVVAQKWDEKRLSTHLLDCFAAEAGKYRARLKETI